MIRQGIVSFPHRLFGYGGFATQEEAERLSDGVHHEGLIVFIPLSHVNLADVKRHIIDPKEVDV